LGEIEGRFPAIYQLQSARHPFHDDPTSNTTAPSTPLSNSSNPGLLPTRLPLKRRLAEFRQSANIKSSAEDQERFSTGLWAVERFRDLSPSFVLALHPTGLLLEPGEIGPIPYGHPLARELIWALNVQQVTPALAEVVVAAGAQWYDGCLVVGLVDYRKQAFNTAASNGQPATQKTSSLTKQNGMHPEMHKILLKSSHRSLLSSLESDEVSCSTEVLLQAESRLLVLT